MATHGHAAPSAARAGQPSSFAAPMPVAAAAAPAGTFTSGTKIQVGSHRVVIQKYLSEGGFAHVYLVKMPQPINGTDQAVLKRVAVPDKDSLRGMRTEVETMKRLKGHKPIVTYIDSHASEMRGGGYEVFLLMEYCNGGGLIDFMNTRLQHRLTEPEILNIFTDVAEGVACMHYLKPPLLHRDLKVENVLITVTGSTRKFKLCDFGSAAPPKPAPTTVVECRLMDEDVQKHTTMQYRSPEMIDVYRKQPIDEKSDIWALGVLLYKLCYYTTPFEEQGQLAILNASYKFPNYPVFSDRLKRLIASMLRENQKSRPNIYQVLLEACAMQGRQVPVKDIYSGRAHSQPPGSERSSAIEDSKAPGVVVGAVFAPPTQQQQAIPEIERMRRGRPPPAAQPVAQPVKPNPSPQKITNGDPFAALDAKGGAKGEDELSSRFPTLDEFSILHSSGAKFEFDSTLTSPPPAQQTTKDLSQRVSERLADEAFGAPQPNLKPAPASSSQRVSVEISRGNPYIGVPTDPKAPASPPKSASAPPKPTEMSRASAIISSTPELQAISSRASQPISQPTPRPAMVSTGTMTSTPPPDRPKSTQYQVYRFPPSGEPSRPSSTAPRASLENPSVGLLRTDTPSSSRPSQPLRGPSFQSQPGHARQPSSSRPSLEGGRPSAEALEPLAKSRSSASMRPRPVSTHLESNLDYLREREGSSKAFITPAQRSPRFVEKDLPQLPEPDDEMNIASNVDFLRSLEESDPKKKEKQPKRSSLTSFGAGTKNILSGKFGDAFKRFETHGGSKESAIPRTPSPLKDLDRRDLTPIAGSEAADGRSDDGNVLEETDDMPPEMRREIERRRLSMEEKRVAAAAAEYKTRVANRPPGGGTGPTPLPKSIGGVSRAVSIQNKVQSLLEESSRSTSNVARTAEGYGHYSEAARDVMRPPGEGRPPIPRKPIGGQPSRPVPVANSIETDLRRSSTIASTPSDASGSRSIPRPTAPPKPMHLNKNVTAGGSLPGGSPPKPEMPSSRINMPRTRPPVASAGREHLMAMDMPGQPTIQMTAAEKEDYIRDFQKRFPSLTSIEMVERDLAAEAAAAEGGRPAR